MNQTDETERALRAATCQYCALGQPEVIWCGKPVHDVPGSFLIHYNACTSKHAELLPVFQQAVEQAGINHDERWVDAMGWTDLVHNGPYTQDDRKRYVKLLVESVTYNMHEEAPPEQIATAVAGAYAAAAKHFEKAFEQNWTVQDTLEAIRNLTPADARQAQTERDEKLRVGFSVECERFHNEGRKCSTCSRVDYSEADMAAAIASAEARARLGEHVMYCNFCTIATVEDANGYCSRGKKLLAAARTPDSTKEPEKS